MFSLNISTTQGNGLSVSESGLQLAVATETSAGAMSADDKYKVNQALTSSDFQEITADEVKALFS